MGKLEIIKKECLFSEEQKWFCSCHSNTQVRLSDTERLAAFWAGTSEGTPDQAIWTVRYKNGEWQEPVRTKNIYQLPHWNSVLLLDKRNILHLYYKVGLTVQSWYTMVSDSLYLEEEEGEFSYPSVTAEGDILHIIYTANRRTFKYCQIKYR